MQSQFNNDESTDLNYLTMREYSRVDAIIPLEVRLVPAEELAAIRAEVSEETCLEEFPDLPEVSDKVLAEWLKMLNAKLDTLIAVNNSRRMDECPYPRVQVNISGGGICLPSTVSYDFGAVLELKMMLPLAPYIMLRVYGEVVKNEEQAPSGKVAVKFIAMDDEIQDQIVRFVVAKWRGIIRQKRFNSE